MLLKLQHYNFHPDKLMQVSILSAPDTLLIEFNKGTFLEIGVSSELDNCKHAGGSGCMHLWKNTAG